MGESEIPLHWILWGGQEVEAEVVHVEVDREATPDARGEVGGALAPEGFWVQVNVCCLHLMHWPFGCAGIMLGVVVMR